MEAKHKNQFVVDHTFVSAMILTLLVGSLSVIITLAVTGNLAALSETGAEVSTSEAAVINPYSMEGPNDARPHH